MKKRRKKKQKNEKTHLFSFISDCRRTPLATQGNGQM
jgi:hypothetical protein